MSSYYTNLFVRSLLAIPRSLGSNTLGVVWPVVIVACAEIIACLFYGWRVMIAKWKSHSLRGLAALGICYTLLFAWCGLQVNFQDHASLTSQVTSLQLSYDRNAAHEKDEVLKAQSECSKLIGANETLIKQNRELQISIDTCQAEVNRKLVPEAMKIGRFVLTTDEKGPSDYGDEFLIVSNKSISPVTLHGKCVGDLKLLFAHAVNQVAAGGVGGFQMGDPSHPHEQSLRMSSTLGPSSPYIVWIRHIQPNSQCSVTVDE